MAGVAWPLVQAKLVAALPAVVGTGTEVFDGPVVTSVNPPAYLTIGHQPSVEDSDAGEFEQQVSPDGYYSVIEHGIVRAELAARSGDATLPDVWATFGLIAAWVQADMTLGGTLYPAATTTVAAGVVPAQTSSGAVRRLLVTFNYLTRL